MMEYMQRKPAVRQEAPAPTLSYAPMKELTSRPKILPDNDPNDDNKKDRKESQVSSAQQTRKEPDTGDVSSRPTTGDHVKLQATSKDVKKSSTSSNVDDSKNDKSPDEETFETERQLHDVSQEHSKTKSTASSSRPTPAPAATAAAATPSPIRATTNHHPGMDAFWHWYDVETSLYRIYTLRRQDGVPVAPPYIPHSYRGQTSVNLHDTNSLSVTLKVYWVDYKSSQKSSLGTRDK